MRSFDYHRPTSLSEASAALAAEPEARLLAGGMTLIPALKMRLASPAALVDLGRARRVARHQSRQRQRRHVGAMTTHAEVAASPDVRSAIPALADLAGGIGDPQVRNRGTIGGSIANNDPAADYPGRPARTRLRRSPPTSARSRPKLSSPACSRPRSDTGEIITAVTFPGAARGGLREVSQPGVALCAGRRLRRQDRRPVSASRSPVRHRACFARQRSKLPCPEKFTPEALAGLRIPADGLNADMHGDADYRAHLIGVLARRAVEKVLGVGGKR